MRTIFFKSPKTLAAYTKNRFQNCANQNTEIVPCLCTNDFAVIITAEHEGTLITEKLVMCKKCYKANVNEN